MSNVSRLAERRWRRMQAELDHDAEILERSRSMHPAGAALLPPRPVAVAMTEPAAVAETPAPDAVA